MEQWISSTTLLISDSILVNIQSAKKKQPEKMLKSVLEDFLLFRIVLLI